jgi:hypothetical protein
MWRKSYISRQLLLMGVPFVQVSRLRKVRLKKAPKGVQGATGLKDTKVDTATHLLVV